MVFRAMVSLCLATTLAGACSGSIADGLGGDEPGTSTGAGQGGSKVGPKTGAGVAGTNGGAGSTGVTVPPPATASVGPAGLRRLTRPELDNTLRDLLGDDTHVARKFVADPSSVANGYVAFQPLGSAELQQYRDAAETLATSAVQRLSTIAPCAAGADELTCAKSFVADFGKRAFRRPLEADEAQLIVDLYSNVRTKTKGTHADGIRVVLAAMLQDPRFLYQRQLGAGAPNANGLVALDSHDMASRLSYALWRTMPDAKLFEAAAAGRLSTEAEVRAQATRMLADPRARQATATWAASLIGLDKLDGLTRPVDKYPEWSVALAASMHAETEAFVASVVLDGDGKLETLLTAPMAFVDSSLAKLYGVTMASGTAPTRVDLDPKRRAGILTQASFLTASPSPVLRGKFVREQLFCQHIPSPPADAQGKGKLAPAGSTERDRTKAHSTDPSCAGCHSLMDPLGFPMLTFDAIGRYQSTDQNKAIDDSGELTGTDVDGPVVGAVALAQRLGKSADVKACITQRWFRAILDRADVAADATSLAAASTAMATGAKPMRDVLLALTTSPAFRYRMPLAGEKTP